MTYLPKQLQKEAFRYSSNKTTSDLTAEIQKTLSGHFTSDNTFYVTGKDALFFSDSGASGHNSLKGTLTAKGTTVIIDVVINPAPRIAIETFAPPLFGLFFLYKFIFQSGSVQFSPLLYAFILIILLPCVMLYFGQASKDKLRKRVVAALSLNEI